MSCLGDVLRVGSLLVALGAAAGLGGCNTTGNTAMASADAAAEPLDISAVPPPADPFHRGLYYFNRADYGSAERYLREAVEKTPNNTGAWIALAASYDNIRRFAFADRAYATAISLAGETPQILNNQGLSYMLRGDLRTARAKIVKALKLDPQNATARNNLRLVETRLVERRRPSWAEDDR